jgi:DNA polymerase-3 subunit epsilon
MLKNIRLERPLAFIDVETTGLKPASDRIIEISIFKVHPNGKEEYKNQRINPETPIPPESTAIHGITEADVMSKPTFRQFAHGIKEFLEDSDISGFNIIKFDLPFLEAEFTRCGIEFSRRNRKIIDSQIIYHQMDPRDLQAAYRKYCGSEMEVVHTAEGDANAAAKILDGQLEKHQDLPRDLASLSAMCFSVPDNYVDFDGKFVWLDGEAICNFGKKHSGHRLKDIVAEDPGYLQWIATADFSTEVKEIVNNALQGTYPRRN